MMFQFYIFNMICGGCVYFVICVLFDVDFWVCIEIDLFVCLVEVQFECDESVLLVVLFVVGYLYIVWFDVVCS